MSSAFLIKVTFAFVNTECFSLHGDWSYGEIMGVNIYLLERRRSPLAIGETRHQIGIIRRFFKITEIDNDRREQIEAAAANAVPSPSAVMLAEVDEDHSTASGATVKSHLIIGWDEGRAHVTDMDWEYLPILGYAVRNANGEFELHEQRQDILCPMDADRAKALGLISLEGRLIQRGQPLVSACSGVRPYINGYAEADCILTDGRKEKLLISIHDGQLPDANWIVGKKPMQIREFFPAPPGAEQPAADFP